MDDFDFSAEHEEFDTSDHDQDSLIDTPEFGQPDPVSLGDTGAPHDHDHSFESEAANSEVDATEAHSDGNHISEENDYAYAETLQANLEPESSGNFSGESCDHDDLTLGKFLRTGAEHMTKSTIVDNPMFESLVEIAGPLSKIVGFAVEKVSDEVWDMI